MSTFALKCAAILTMLIDHIGLLFFPQFPIFRMIGRVSFPIFCFLLAQGFTYTRSRRHYMIRLLVFGVISEIPHQLFLYGDPYWKWGRSINVMFELFAGIVVLTLFELAVKKRGNVFWISSCIAGSLIICFLTEQLNVSYGAYGILLIVGFYLFREKRHLQCLILIACTLTYCLVQGIVVQGYAVLACLFLWGYNSERGKKLHKYVFYLFYPVHLLVLYGISLIVQ